MTNVTVAGIIFDHNSYDPEGDVLYLNVGKPGGGAIDFDDTPEGHNVGWNAAGEIVTIGLLHPRAILAKYGKIEITLPEITIPQHHVDIDAAGLDQALLAA